MLVHTLESLSVIPWITKSSKALLTFSLPLTDDRTSDYWKSRGRKRVWRVGLEVGVAQEKALEASQFLLAPLPHVVQEWHTTVSS